MHAADVAAIEKLHQEDIEATLTQDPKGLIDIWAEDAVRFNPGGAPCDSRKPRELELDLLYVLRDFGNTSGCGCSVSDGK
jgi:hypothetical protein